MSHFFKGGFRVAPEVNGIVETTTSPSKGVNRSCGGVVFITDEEVIEYCQKDIIWDIIRRR